jgi:hypothetical protein
MLWITLSLALPFGVEPAAGAPWKSGEHLTFEIRWGIVLAAEADFLAEKNGDLWRMSAYVRSRGIVESMYPIRSRFSSLIQPSPWRPLEFEADRKEGKCDGQWRNNKQQIIWFDYASSKGRFQDRRNGRDIQFDLPSGGLQDLLSMLYGVRQHDWGQASQISFNVAGRDKMDKGQARLVKKAAMSIDGWPCQNLALVEAWQVRDSKDIEKDGPGVTAQVWVTDDYRRLPLQARARFNFGTISIHLKSIGEGSSATFARHFDSRSPSS